jgi:putative membrane protein
MNNTFALPFPYGKIQVSVFAIWLVTVSGMIGIWLGQGDWFLPKTPFNLLLGVGLLYWNFPMNNGWRSLSVWTLVYLIGMGVEIVGVNTGLLFGNYHYGKNLGLKLFGVPLLIGINWVVLTFLTATICKRFIGRKWLALICGAMLMVALDFFIEPVAPVFDFWHWNEGHAPFRNFVDWFVVSLILQAIVQKDLSEGKNPLPMHHFASQAVFFAFFYAVYQF